MSLPLMSLIFTCVAFTCIGVVDTRGSDNEYVFNIPHVLNDGPHVLITTSSPSPIVTTLTIPGLGYQVTNNVTRDNPVEIILSRALVGINVKLYGNERSNSKTLVLLASGEISVNVVDNDYAGADVFTISPTSQLGTVYRVASYTPYTMFSSSRNISLPSFWSLSSVYSDTVVNVTTVSGQHRQVVLERHESVRFDNRAAGEDVSGTVIHSNQPVVVMGGADAVIPVGTCCRSGFIEQLPSVKSWGDKFTLTPFLSLNSGYVYRVFTDIHSVTLHMTDGTTERVEAGSFYEGDVTGNSITSFTSDKPVMVAQYMKTCDRGHASMVIVPPMTSFRNIVTFYVFPLDLRFSYTYYINVVADCNHVDGLWLDGSRLMDIAVSNVRSDENLCCVRTNVSAGSHIVRGSNSSFYHVIVYALGRVVAYVFAAETFGAVVSRLEKSTSQPDASSQPEYGFYTSTTQTDASLQPGLKIQVPPSPDLIIPLAVMVGIGVAVFVIIILLVVLTICLRTYKGRSNDANDANDQLLMTNTNS